METKLSLLRTLFEDLKSNIDVPLIIKQLRKLTEPQKVLLAVFAKSLLLPTAVNAVSKPSASISKRLRTVEGVVNSPSSVWDEAPKALQFLAITTPQMA